MRQSYLFLLALCIAGLVVFAHYHWGWLPTPQSEQLLNSIGLFITAFSFLFAAYFAILAVTAYAHISDIESKAVDAKRLHADATREFQNLHALIEQTKTSASQEFEALRVTMDDARGQGTDFLRYLSEMVQVVSQFMTAVDKQAEAGARVKELHLAFKRFRFATTRSSPGERLDAARELVEFGERSDLDAVEPFLVTSRDPDARALLPILRAKLYAFDQRQKRHSG